MKPALEGDVRWTPAAHRYTSRLMRNILLFVTRDTTLPDIHYSSPLLFVTSFDNHYDLHSTMLLLPTYTFHPKLG